jgi:hypothetical protein
VRGEARTRGEERGRRVSGKGGRGGGSDGTTDRLRHPSLACSSGSSSTAPSTFATSMKHAAGMRLARRRTGAERGGGRVRRRDGWARSGSRLLCHRQLNPKTEKCADRQSLHPCVCVRRETKDVMCTACPSTAAVAHGLAKPCIDRDNTARCI